MVWIFMKAPLKEIRTPTTASPLAGNLLNIWLTVQSDLLYCPAYPLTRLPAYPLTRLPAYPLTRLPAYPLTRLPAYPLPSHAPPSTTMIAPVIQSPAELARNVTV